MESQLEEVQVTIKQSKEAIALMNSVLKLTENKDFKAVITEGYFEKEASRLVLLKADPSLQNEKEQLEIDRRIIAVGYLRQYLSYIVQIGRMAEKSLQDAEETQQELMQE